MGSKLSILVSLVSLVSRAVHRGWKALHVLGNDLARFRLHCPNPNNVTLTTIPKMPHAMLQQISVQVAQRCAFVYVQHEHGSMTLTASPPNSNKDLGTACSVSVTVRMQHQS